MNLSIGSRVDVNGHKGKLKYIGIVQGYNGEWIGIDWDDPMRGKHNGTVNGVKYFEARCPTSGSFVRPIYACSGRDLVEEINSRYAEGNVDKSSNDSSENFLAASLPAINIGIKKCEYVGMEKTYLKQCNIYRLNVIVLDNMCVSHVSPHQTSKFIHCTELNLHNNLITTWTNVFDILRLFPSLRYLNLCKNLLEPLGDISILDLSDLPSIFHLILSDCQMNEKTVTSILRIFNQVTELHISRTGITSFDPPDNCFLRHLNISENPIEDFSRLWSLSQLKSLEILNAAGCNFQTFDLPPNEVGFEKLSNLIIDDNSFTQWSDINQLSRLPSLKRLKLRGNMTEQNRMDIREIIIAKMPLLVELDRCDISSIERRSSEIRFINRFGLEPIDEVHRKDVERLVAKHGPPDPPVEQNLATARQKIPTVQIKLRYEDKKIERSVPEVTTIQRLIGLASRILKFDPSEVKIEICRNGMPSETLHHTNDLQLNHLDLNTESSG